MTESNEVILSLKHMQKSYGNHQVLKDISFDINKGSLVLLVVVNQLLCVVSTCLKNQLAARSIFTVKISCIPATTVTPLDQRSVWFSSNLTYLKTKTS